MTSADVKFTRLLRGRGKLDAQLQKLYLDLDDVIERKKRRERVEKTLETCKNILEKATDINDQLRTLAPKTENPHPKQHELDQWQSSSVSKHDIAANKARSYLDSIEETDLATDNASTVQSHYSSLTKSSSHLSSVTSSALASMTSSQRKKRLAAARLRREEAERQRDAELQLAEEKHQLELKTIAENSLRKINEAKITELEFKDAASQNADN